MRNNLAILITGLIIALGGSRACNADLVVTWEDVGGDLIYSIDGTWSSWESTTPSVVQTNTLTFDGNGFDLSRGLVDGNGVNVIMDVRSGTGSVDGPTFGFPAPLPTTGFRLEHLNLGGFLVLDAELPGIGSTFTISESFNLGTGYTLDAGTRTFSTSNFPSGDTLTMNYVTSAVPEPSSFALFGFGTIAAFSRRRRNKQ